MDFSVIPNPEISEFFSQKNRNLGIPKSRDWGRYFWDITGFLKSFYQFFLLGLQCDKHLVKTVNLFHFIFKLNSKKIIDFFENLRVFERFQEIPGYFRKFRDGDPGI